VAGYPIETALAEKIVTMIDRGDTTTRERDFADVVLLARRPAIHASRCLRPSRRPLRTVAPTCGPFGRYS